MVSSGVLPARNEHLKRLAPWLEHLLHDKPAHHARLIRPFALEQRGQDLCDLTQADLDQWLTDGTTTRRAVRYFLQWAHRRGLAGDLNVPRHWTFGSVERSFCSSGCWSAGSSS